MDNCKILNHCPKGIVDIPPSKSIAHRAILCAGMAKGESVLRNVELSEDITATLEGIRELGAKYVYKDGVCKIRGGLSRGGTFRIDCGESGSTLRFLIPIAAALNKKGCFTGRGRLMERPMSPYSDMGIIGCQCDVKERLSGGKYKLPGNISSQFVTGLLLALSFTDTGGEVVIEGELESASYVELTIEVMKSFGMCVLQEGLSRFTVEGGKEYRAAEYTVQADYSQAAFFLVASALGYPVECNGLQTSSAQGDRAILNILKQCGAQISVGSHGGLIATSHKLKPITVDVSNIPDLVPVLAVLFSFCDGESLIFNAARLHFKESDRLNAIASELNKLGGQVEVGEDYLRIIGVKSLKGGRVESWGDHRIAMAMAVASLRCDNSVTVSGWEDVAKSYPNFWKDFEKEDRLI